jgi:hypothetical protein
MRVSCDVLLRAEPFFELIRRRDPATVRNSATVPHAFPRTLPKRVGVKDAVDGPDQ